MEKASNGQFQELIGKLLVKGSEQKVPFINKKQIQEKIDLLSSVKNGDAVFFSFINFINTEYNLQSFVSKFIQKTTTLTIPKSPERFEITMNSVADFLQPIFEREQNTGSDLPFIYKIWNSFNRQKVCGVPEDFTTTIYRLPFLLTHRQIRGIENIEGGKTFSFLEALSIIQMAILAGEVDEKEKCLAVYFSEGKNGLHLLHAERNVFQVSIVPYKVNQDIYLKGKVDQNTYLKGGDGICFGKTLLE